MKDQPMSAGIILMLLMLAATQFLAGCGDFWQAPGSTGTTASTTVLSPATTAPVAGTSDTLTATVTTSSGTGTPAGTVVFYDGTTSLGTETLSSGTTTLPATFITTGAHTLTAVYGGSTTYAASTSSAVTATVSAPTGTTASTTTLAGPTTAPTAGVSFTLTATVAPGTPTGTVAFYNGTTLLGIGALNESSPDTAALATTFSTAGTYSAITATYIGDSTYATSTSSPLSITVGP